MTLDTIALIFNGDAYVLEVAMDSNTILHIQRILCFADNQNVAASDERFFDLDEQTRRAILDRVRKRYPQHSVKIQ